MTSLHALGAVAALVAAATLGLAAGLVSWRDRAHEPMKVAAWLAVAIFGVAALLGLATLASGSSPRDWLHVLYAAVLLAVVPVGLTFASDAPPRARSGVLAVAGLVALLIVWRLFATA